MTDDDKLIESMFDEVIETSIKPDGEVEVNLIKPCPEEMEEAVAEWVRSERRFAEYNQPGGSLNNKWWVELQWLALADAKLKDLFCGRDRSPRSIAMCHKYRMNLAAGRRYRTDA